MKCQCPAAGYCHTHQRQMSVTRHRQCSTEPGYYEAFQLDLQRGESTGVGNRVASVTRSTGVDRLAHIYTAITGRDCGCDGRRRWLNRNITWAAVRRLVAWLFGRNHT
jgi:hypothetical protein